MTEEQQPCHVVDVDGDPIRVHGDVGAWDDRDRDAFTEVVRAARRRFDEEQADPVKAAYRELRVTMGGIGSHADPCRIPDTSCLCGVAGARRDGRAAVTRVFDHLIATLERSTP